MKSRLWLVAINVAMLALFPSNIAAGPVDTVMRWMGLAPEVGFLLPMSPEAQDRAVVSDADLLPSDREAEAPEEDENVDNNVWVEWMDFNPQLGAFRTMISIDGEEVDISTETADGDTVVCPQAEELELALVRLEKKRQKVIEGHEAKVKLLENLSEVIHDMEDEFDSSVLNCDIGGESGDNDCFIMSKMLEATTKEGDQLDDKEDTIAEYAEQVKRYQCACTYGQWSQWGPCQGGKEVEVYDHCDPSGSEDECEAEPGLCEDGEKTRTRSLLWPERNSGGECGAADLPQDEVKKVSTEGGVQTHTENCPAGKHGGHCPVSCIWSEWDSSLENGACFTAVCDVQHQKSQTIYRKRIQFANYGGKPCFGDSSMSQKCPYETAAKQQIDAKKEEVKMMQTQFDTLKAAMCAANDGKGPCQNGYCKVEFDDNTNVVTKWCICDSGWGGAWCHQNIATQN